LFANKVHFWYRSINIEKDQATRLFVGDMPMQFWKPENMQQLAVVTKYKIAFRFINWTLKRNVLNPIFNVK
jgi:hypothetical protein